MPPSRAKGPEPRIRTFDEAFAELHLTKKERKDLVWHLAGIRTRRLMDTLLPDEPGSTMNEEMLAVLRERGAEQDLRK